MNYRTVVCAIYLVLWLFCAAALAQQEDQLQSPNLEEKTVLEPCDIYKATDGAISFTYTFKDYRSLRGTQFQSFPSTEMEQINFLRKQIVLMADVVCLENLLYGSSMVSASVLAIKKDLRIMYSTELATLKHDILFLVPNANRLSFGLKKPKFTNLQVQQLVQAAIDAETIRPNPYNSFQRMIFLPHSNVPVHSAFQLLIMTHNDLAHYINTRNVQDFEFAKVKATAYNVTLKLIQPPP